MQGRRPVGHDLRRTHHVVVMHDAAVSPSLLAAAAGRAATSLHLDHLQGRHGTMVVLLVGGRPDPSEFANALARALGGPTTTVGIGSGCETPRDFPDSFDKARRALNVRLHSSNLEGVSAYDQLGFYHLVDAAHATGAAEDFVSNWLGVLVNYDIPRVWRQL